MMRKIKSQIYIKLFSVIIYDNHIFSDIIYTYKIESFF